MISSDSARVSGSSGCLRLISTHTAARRTGIPERTLRYWAITGKVRAQKIGKRAWRLAASDVDQLAHNRECCHAYI